MWNQPIHEGLFSRTLAHANRENGIRQGYRGRRLEVRSECRNKSSGPRERSPDGLAIPRGLFVRASCPPNSFSLKQWINYLTNITLQSTPIVIHPLPLGVVIHETFLCTQAIEEGRKKDATLSIGIYASVAHHQCITNSSFVVTITLGV